MAQEAQRVREGGVAPVQVRGTVLTIRRVDAYVAMTVVAPAIATRFRPGQFIAVAVGGPQSSMLARRAFSVHDVRPDHGGTVEFVFLPREPGTQWLADCRSRDVLDVVGPLGRPFPVPRDPVSCLLLGVGTATAPLFSLAARLADRGCPTDFLLGGESADRVFGALTARRTGRSAVVTTADGSMGSRGSVTDMLPTVMQQARTDVIYAAAPLPVLRSVCALARRYSLPVQALVSEPDLTCGTGLCQGCVLPVVGNDGITRMARACTDGPVFRGDQVRWDDVGTIPFDALGAPGWKPRAGAAQQPDASAGLSGSAGPPDSAPPARPGGGRPASAPPASGPSAKPGPTASGGGRSSGGRASGGRSHAG
jgi:dihydroorotate dehydrogenase electron transfer subunit